MPRDDGSARFTFAAKRLSVEVTTMKLTLWLVTCIALAIPAILFAIALGPVTVGILCAVGFGLVVFAIANLFVALGAGIEKAGSRLARHR
jgi:predicted anti-sigma-YlaC factor YlaD